MSILKIWKSNPENIENKSISQILSFCGDGNLKDNSETSKELRSYLKEIPSDLIKKYVSECTESSFKDNGLLLQDIINEIGYRLGFKIKPGLYRGTKSNNAFDGLWETDDNSIIIEVKTSDAYRINLDTLNKYKEKALKENILNSTNVSFLLVVLREDTGDLEAQIRGSRLSWDTRLISVDALIKMLEIKENSEQLEIVDKIKKILIPEEYTRLDKIVDMAFSAIEEGLSQANSPNQNSELVFESDKPIQKDIDKNKSIHIEAVNRAEQKLNCVLKKENRSIYTNDSKNITIVCKVSKAYPKPDNTEIYWFGFYFNQKEILQKSEKAFILLGCAEKNQIFLLPFNDFKLHIEKLSHTKSDSLFYHIVISKSNSEFTFNVPGENGISITKYTL